MIPEVGCAECPRVRDSAFACLKPAQRSALASVALSHVYERDQTIFHQGTPALAVYCLQSGLVKLTRHFDHGERVVVALRSAGDLFGHRAVLSGRPHGLSAETLEPSVVCTIPREHFVAILDESHELTLQLLKRLAREYDITEEHLAERSEEPVRKRTARFLAKLAQSAAATGHGGEPVPVPTRREDLALLLGTTPETLSRTLHDLARRGLVDVDRKEIRVLDPARLQRLAG